MSARTLSDLMGCRDNLYQRMQVRLSMSPHDPATNDIVACMDAILKIASHVLSETETKRAAA